MKGLEVAWAEGGSTQGWCTQGHLELLRRVQPALRKAGGFSRDKHHPAPPTPQGALSPLCLALGSACYLQTCWTAGPAAS